jgi:hypothetical protein
MMEFVTVGMMKLPTVSWKVIIHSMVVTTKQADDIGMIENKV